MKIVIPKEYLEYAGALARGTVNKASGEMELEIQETIEIFTSKSHSESSKWGTLELHIKAKENLNQEPIFPATIGEVSGHGTGALPRPLRKATCRPRPLTNAPGFHSGTNVAGHSRTSRTSTKARKLWPI